MNIINDLDKRVNLATNPDVYSTGGWFLYTKLLAERECIGLQCTLTLPCVCPGSRTPVYSYVAETTGAQCGARRCSVAADVHIRHRNPHKHPVAIQRELTQDKLTLPPSLNKNNQETYIY